MRTSSPHDQCRKCRSCNQERPCAICKDLGADYWTSLKKRGKRGPPKSPKIKEKVSHKKKKPKKTDSPNKDVSSVSNTGIILQDQQSADGGNVNAKHPNGNPDVTTIGASSEVSHTPVLSDSEITRDARQPPHNIIDFPLKNGKDFKCLDDHGNVWSFDAIGNDVKVTWEVPEDGQIRVGKKRYKDISNFVEVFDLIGKLHYTFLRANLTFPHTNHPLYGSVPTREERSRSPSPSSSISKEEIIETARELSERDKWLKQQPKATTTPGARETTHRREPSQDSAPHESARGSRESSHDSHHSPVHDMRETSDSDDDISDNLRKRKRSRSRSTSPEDGYRERTVSGTQEGRRGDEHDQRVSFAKTSYTQRYARSTRDTSDTRETRDTRDTRAKGGTRTVRESSLERLSHSYIDSDGHLRSGVPRYRVEYSQRRGRSPYRRRPRYTSPVTESIRTDYGPQGPLTTITDLGSFSSCGKYGCLYGCRRCADFFLCRFCSRDYEHCPCYTGERTDMSAYRSPPNPTRRTKSSDREVVSTRMDTHIKDMEAQLAKMTKDLEASKVQLAKHNESPSTSPARLPSTRRRKSRTRPRREDEPLEPVDMDAVTQPTDWQKVEECIAKYTETKDAEANSVLAAEEPTPSMSDDKIKERRQLRVKHRLLLYACQELDETMEVVEDPAATTWSSSSTRPVSSVDAEEVVLPPIVRNYLHPSILQDIRVTGERALTTNKASDKKTPLRLEQFPKDEKCFTTSWLPADDKLFPQAHLSDESTLKLHRDLAKGTYSKPSTVQVTETQLQEFAARGRSSVQASSLIQQLLRVLKVLATSRRRHARKDSKSMKSCMLSCDVVDRAADILNQVTRQSLQTIHTQTLILRTAYLKTFPKEEISPEELPNMRSATLFSSQVLPTQACYSALKNARTTATLETSQLLTLSLGSTLTRGKGPSKPQGQSFTGNTGSGGGGRKRGRSRSRSRGRQDNGPPKRQRSQSQNRGPPPRSDYQSGGYQGGGYQGGGFQGGGYKGNNRQTNQKRGPKGAKGPYRPKKGP